MKKLILFTVVSLLFVACKKSGYDAELDYDYPFAIEFTTDTESVLGTEIPITINFQNKSEYENPSKEYTLKFQSTGGGYLKNSSGQIFDSTHEIKVVDEGKPVTFFYNPSSTGQQTLTLTFVNKQNNSVEVKTTYSIDGASFQLTTVEKDFEVLQGQDLNINLGVTENTTFDTPYQLSVNNLTDVDYVELNGQKISPNTFVSLQNINAINLIIRYNKAGSYKPLIVLKNHDLEFSLPINVKVNQRFLNIISSSLFVVKDNEKSDLKVVSKYNKATANENSYITSNINIESTTNTVFVKFSDTKGSIDKIQYGNQSYYKGDWFLVETSDLKIDDKIKIITKFSNYGDESIKIEIKDNFENEVTPIVVNYRYYSKPTWLEESSLDKYYVADIMNQNNNPFYKNVRNISAIKLSGNGAKIVKLEYEVKIGTKHPTSTAGILNVSVKRLGEFKYDQEIVMFNESWSNLVVYDANVFKQRNSAYLQIDFYITNEFGERHKISRLLSDNPTLLNFI